MYHLFLLDFCRLTSRKLESSIEVVLKSSLDQHETHYLLSRCPSGEDKLLLQLTMSQQEKEGSCPSERLL